MGYIGNYKALAMLTQIELIFKYKYKAGQCFLMSIKIQQNIQGYNGKHFKQKSCKQALKRINKGSYESENDET